MTSLDPYCINSKVLAEYIRFDVSHESISAYVWGFCNLIGLALYNEDVTT